MFIAIDAASALFARLRELMGTVQATTPWLLDAGIFASTTKKKAPEGAFFQDTKPDRIGASGAGRVNTGIYDWCAAGTRQVLGNVTGVYGIRAAIPGSDG